MLERLKKLDKLLTQILEIADEEPKLLQAYVRTITSARTNIRRLLEASAILNKE